MSFPVGAFPINATFVQSEVTVHKENVTSGLSVQGGLAADSFTVSGPTQLGNDLTDTTVINGPAVLKSTLNVKEATTLQSGLTVTGACILGGPIDVGGTVTLNDDLELSGDATIGGDVSIVGVTTLNNDLTLVGNHPTALGGTLDVAGAATVTGALSVTGNTTLNNNLTVVGNKPTALGGTLGVAGVTTLTGGLTLPSTLCGSDVLSAGLKTVVNTRVTANSKIFLQKTGATATTGGTGVLYVTEVNAGTNFKVGSTNNADVSTFNWMIIESL